MGQERHTGSDFCIEALQNGDQRAFEVIFHQYYSALCYFANRMLEDSYGSEEVVCNVLLILWQKRRNFPNEAAIRAFLYISVRNACLNRLDKESRRRRQEQALSFTDDADDSIIEHIFQAEALRRIHQAIDALPEKYGRVIRMAYVDGMKNEEIAETLNLPQSTVRNQKARGLVALKKNLPDGVFSLLVALIGV